MSTEAKRDVITADEAAERLGVNRKSIYRSIELKQLPAIRIGRRVLIPAAAFERLVRGETDDQKAA